MAIIRKVCFLLVMVTMLSISAFAQNESSIVAYGNENEEVLRTPCYEHDLYVDSTEWIRTDTGSDSTHSLRIIVHYNCRNCSHTEANVYDTVESHTYVAGTCSGCGHNR